MVNFSKSVVRVDHISTVNISRVSDRTNVLLQSNWTSYICAFDRFIYILTLARYKDQRSMSNSVSWYWPYNCLRRSRDLLEYLELICNLRAKVPGRSDSIHTAAAVELLVIILNNKDISVCQDGKCKQWSSRMTKFIVNQIQLSDDVFEGFFGKTLRLWGLLMGRSNYQAYAKTVKIM